MGLDAETLAALKSLMGGDNDSIDDVTTYVSAGQAASSYELLNEQSAAAAEAAGQSQAKIEDVWNRFLQQAGGDVNAAKMFFQEQMGDMRVRVAQESEWAAQRADARALALKSDPRYQMGSQYLTESFNAGIPEFMAREYASRLRSAQAASGFESGGGAVAQDEAALLMSMANQNRQTLLPQMMELVTGEYERPLAYAEKEMGLRSAAQDIGTTALSSSMDAYATAIQAELQKSAQLASLYGTGLSSMQFAGRTNAKPIDLFGGVQDSDNTGVYDYSVPRLF